MILEKLPAESKVVMIRTDYDVPMGLNGTILDDSRIKDSLNTIMYLLQKGSRIVIVSSIGRPRQKDNRKSLRILLKKLSELIGIEVQFSDCCVGAKRDDQVANLRKGEILLLENVRFFREEYENDIAFAIKLSINIDIYINDAFSNSHRDHASMTGVPRIVQPKAIGLHARAEMEKITKYLKDPSSPSIGIIGGNKKEKIDHVTKLVSKFDNLIITGKLANYFLAAKKALLPCEKDKEVISKCGDFFGNEYFERILLSTNYINETDCSKIDNKNCYKIFDITPYAIKQFASIIKKSNKIFWNGPVGRYEEKQFENGSKAIVESIYNANANILIGGGDTVAMMNKYGIINNSTKMVASGGALLSFLSDGCLRAIQVISDRK